MGQQQLILLALAVVIVGGAIVVGIRAFNENSVKSNADAMMQDAVRIANDMQAWKQKPAPFGGQASLIGGGGGVTQVIVNTASDFTGASLPLLGYQVVAGTTPLEYANLNGAFTISPSAPWTITGQSIQFQNEVQVVVSGLSDRDLSGSIACLGGTDPTGTVCTVP